MAAQLSQAAGSLVISVISLRTLDLPGFATLSVLLSGVVFVTGLTTGLVGDSLTVLDRFDPAVRAALRTLLLGVCAALLVLGALAAWGGRLVGAVPAAAFGLLLALWVTEDVLRRLLMATLRFWPIVVVDGTHLLVSTTVALGVPAVSGVRASVTLYLVALSCGQVCAGAVALLFLPPAERRWGSRAAGGMRTVLAFGTSRSVQAALRPAVLLLMRILVIAIAGAVAYGHLEAARVYAAPALLVVNGFGSYLLSSFAAGRGATVRTADRACAFLVGATAAITAVAVVLCLAWPHLLSPHVAVAPVAVLAWGLFTGAVAVSQPYGSLAAVAGGQRRVLAIRALDSVVSLAVLGLALGTAVIGPDLAPVALATGPLLAAVLLRPLAGARTAAAPAPARPMTPAPAAAAAPDATPRGQSAAV